MIPDGVTSTRKLAFFPQMRMNRLILHEAKVESMVKPYFKTADGKYLIKVKERYESIYEQ